MRILYACSYEFHSWKIGERILWSAALNSGSSRATDPTIFFTATKGSNKSFKCMMGTFLNNIRIYYLYSWSLVTSTVLLTACDVDPLKPPLFCQIYREFFSQCWRAGGGCLWMVLWVNIPSSVNNFSYSSFKVPTFYKLQNNMTTDSKQRS